MVPSSSPTKLTIAGWLRFGRTDRHEVVDDRLMTAPTRPVEHGQMVVLGPGCDVVSAFDEAADPDPVGPTTQGNRGAADVRCSGSDDKCPTCASRKWSRPTAEISLEVNCWGGWIRTTDYLIQSQVSEISHGLANSGANSKKCGERGRFQASESGELPEKR